MSLLLRTFPLLAMVLLASPAAAAEIGAPAYNATADGARARVLVMLTEAPAAIRATEDFAGGRLPRIAAEVDAALARLPAGHYAVRRRFRSVPALALEADRAALDALAANPAVHSVDLDTGGTGDGAVAPDAASVLNQVSPLLGLGLGGSGMKVAVIDSGVDTDHNDFSGRIVAQQCFCSGPTGSVGCCPNGLDTQAGAGAAEDNHGHGTNVSGIILGAGGVAPRGALPLADLVAVKVLDATNSFCCASDVLAAIDWVRVNHPDVDAVNLSLGTAALFAGDCDASPSFNVAFATAIASLRGVGATITASAGNQSSNTSSSSPACIRDVMGTVATWDGNVGSQTVLGCTESSTAAKQITCFSNLSSTGDIAGAGAYVTAPGNNGGSSTFAGTSQAAPMVAACATALKQLRPAATMDQIEMALETTPTTVSSPRNGVNYPFLDCAASVNRFSVLFADGFE